MTRFDGQSWCPDLDGCYERLVEEHLRSHLRAFYPATDEQDLWLNAPHPLLGGDAPLDRIDRGDWDAVWALIDQLETGAFV